MTNSTQQQCIRACEQKVCFVLPECVRERELLECVRERESGAGDGEVYLASFRNESHAARGFKNWCGEYRGNHGSHHDVSTS